MTEKEIIDTDILDRAIFFATEAHKNMKRKGSVTPYILHPMEAAAIVATMSDEIEVIAAAILHDTVEDNNTIFIEDIEKHFGKRIRNLVEAESEEKEADAAGSWEKRKSATVRYLKSSASEEEKIIALGDKLSNIRTIYKDKQRIGEDVWKRFNQTDKDRHRWYYQSIAEALQSLSAYPAYWEYCRLLDCVFSYSSDA